MPLVYAAGISGDDALSGGDLPFAKELFEACDRLRGSVESAEYKHLVLGLLFLKYISDAFERHRQRLEAATHDPGSDLYSEDDEERASILEDRDEYLATNVFWVPELARWEVLLAAASQPDIAGRIDLALEAIERDNAEQLRGVLPRVYSRSELPAAKMGELVTTIAKVGFGKDEDTARDTLGRTYEYFIKIFAKKEGHRGGEFFTPRSIVRAIVEMVEPFEGRVLDPACGSCGMFIQSAEFVEAHGGRARAIAIYGQEMTHTTWRIGRMNLAIHGLAGNIKGGTSSLTDDQHPGLRADFVMANPPFNQEYWGAEQVADDSRWRYGLAPDRNANFAWIQHFIHHLAPNGRAGFVMANGSLSSTTSGENTIREGIVSGDLVDCIVACPPGLFFTTGIPVSLWFLDRGRAARREEVRGPILFIDARKLGQKISRTQIEFDADEIHQIAATYRAWRGEDGAANYEDVPGFCRSAAFEEVAAQRFNLSPGRYVGHAEDDDDGEVFGDKLKRLGDELEDLFGRSEALQATIRDRLRQLR